MGKKGILYATTLISCSIYFLCAPAPSNINEHLYIMATYKVDIPSHLSGISNDITWVKHMYLSPVTLKYWMVL